MSDPVVWGRGKWLRVAKCFDLNNNTADSPFETSSHPLSLSPKGSAFPHPHPNPDTTATGVLYTSAWRSFHPCLSLHSLLPGPAGMQ